MLPSLVFQQSRRLSTALRSALAAAISKQGRYDFEQRVLVDNHKRMVSENSLRRAQPSIDEPGQHSTFGDGEGSASPYFRSRSGDAAVLVTMVHLKAVENPKNEAEEIDQPWFLLTHRSYFLRSHRGEMSMFLASEIQF
uniref:Uncharacterized protein n=1 Tax=Panagrolaimus sp. JU765 TaxID=591449 RepID=A0AC34QYS1_9BILA